MPLRIDNFAAVLAGAQPHRVSLYQPTHRSFPVIQRDPIHYRNLVKALERSPLEPSLGAAVAEFLAPFDAREHDVAYWTKFLEDEAKAAAWKCGTH